MLDRLGEGELHLNEKSLRKDAICYFLNALQYTKMAKPNGSLLLNLF